MLELIEAEREGQAKERSEFLSVTAARRAIALWSKWRSHLFH